MSTLIKLCGFTRVADVQAALDLGVDAVGVVLSDGPCRLGLREAQALMTPVQRYPTQSVAVAGRLTETEARRLVDAGFDYLQIVEPPVRTLPRGPGILPVFFDGEDLESRVDRWAQPEPRAERSGLEGLVAVDGPSGGGKGMVADWTRAARVARRRSLMLAGGLTSANVRRAIQTVGPAAVDVSSGVESERGTKDHAKMGAFVQAVRSAV